MSDYVLPLGKFDDPEVLCATVCMYALDDICRCECGGINHGRFANKDWEGYECEGCGRYFGVHPRPLGAVARYGTSARVKTRCGKPARALWCGPCWAKYKPDWWDDPRFSWRAESVGNFR